MSRLYLQKLKLLIWLPALLGLAQIILIADIHAEQKTPSILKLAPGPAWQVVGIFSGSNTYYTFTKSKQGEAFIHAHYRPPQQTVTLGYRLKNPKPYRYFSWRWRVGQFPINADEKIEGHMDNAAAVYLTFASGLRRYVIKYIWSTKYPPGANWRTTSGILKKMQVVVRQGPPTVTDSWHHESIVITNEFHRYFGGDIKDKPPPIAGVGILSDGDGTRSEVKADYSDFLLYD
ncbi:MAG: DUF3047 domain-containing protein [Deltaproteobacteria bacterium]|nr:DUF3047 domain-containing protein [Deltaproteobacteria bacterium]